ncbi:hypothetical protein SBA3_20017 [Candidatus Sulfopaludibacter sp. SbA3]|nr:hypothetical protein SBA3_20017 [Candidatus Sulfopaludibacter sp. SbA3]
MTRHPPRIEIRKPRQDFADRVHGSRRKEPVGSRRKEPVHFVPEPDFDPTVPNAADPNIDFAIVDFMMFIPEISTHDPPFTPGPALAVWAVAG